MCASAPVTRRLARLASVLAAAFFLTLAAPAISRGGPWDPTKYDRTTYVVYEPPSALRAFVPPPYPVVVYLHGAFEQKRCGRLVAGLACDDRRPQGAEARVRRAGKPQRHAE